MRPVQGKTRIKRSRLDGYGVFALRDIRKGEVIEQMPALCIKHGHLTSEGLNGQSSPMSTHGYHPTGLKEVWIGTGTSSFYNAAKNFNADMEFEYQEEGDWIIIVANRPIKAGEEITLDYLQEEDTTWMQAST